MIKLGIGRRAFVFSALGAGVAYANLAVGLPLLALAEHRSGFVAGGLLGVDTLAFSLGALLAVLLRRSETGVAVGLAAIAAGDLIFVVLPSVTGTLFAGALVHGTGMGLFWVGTQASLGRRSGASGSQRAFVGQYVLYVAGTATGAALTGAAIALLRVFGVAHAESIRASFVLGAASALLALPTVVAWLRRLEVSPIARPTPSPLHGFALQLPDLLLVAAMGMQLNLAPIVLVRVFGFTPLAISAVAGAVAAAKIGGSFAAGRITPSVGASRAVCAMLSLSALSVALLIGTHDAWLYVALTVAAAFMAIGVWPVVVDGALARVSPEQRHALSIVWNVREYAAIAATMVLGSYLFDAYGQPTLVLALTAGLLAAAAVSALLVLARPVYAPRVV